MARLPDDRKEQIRDATPIDELVTSYGIRLRQRGRLLWGLCPFHQDAHPSLSVDTVKGRFRCWSCDTGGDVFHFVELFEGVEFYEALVMLAERAGISLAGGRRPEPGEANRRKNQKSYLLKLNGAAGRFFREQLNAETGRAAREYLAKRGLSEETLQAFGVGYAPAGNALIRALGKTDAHQRALDAAGLARWSERREGELYDWFRNRLMFPIRNIQGRVVGFAGRSLDEDTQPKYINTQETAVFRKGKVLYNLDAARDAIREQGGAILVEGYTDVMMCVQHGIENVVAPMGTAFGEDHVRLIRGQADRLTLVFDADDAGQNAAEKAVENCLAQGLACKVVTLPGDRGSDPCELLSAADGPAAFRTALDQAVEGFRYALERVCARFNLDDPVEKGRAAEQLMQLAARAENPVTRDEYRRRISERLDVREDTLKFPGEPRRREPRTPEVARPQLGRQERQERLVIVYCVQQPAFFRELQAVIGVDNLSDPQVKEIARSLVLVLEGEDQASDEEHVLAALENEDAREFLFRELERRRQEQEMGRISLEDQFQKALNDLRRTLIENERNQVSAERDAAERAGDNDRERQLVLRDRELRLQIRELAGQD